MLEERDASEMFADPNDPLLSTLRAGHSVEEVRGLVLSVSVRAVKPA